ncbi:FHA domain-containing protein [Nocardioides dubius]|uniref:FHA domain-containing protein n=1 Tax=Nocardioides dubius TaxID=317019 RepID=A0ABN1U360_9ACTN
MSENSTSFHAGDWFGIVGAKVQVYLPPSEKPRVAGLWELVDAGADFDEVLDALISGGLRALPAFALLSVDGDAARVVLRGAVSAEFTVAADVVTLDGRDAATWLEQSLSSVSQARLLLQEVEEAVVGLLPGGLVRVAQVDHPAVVEVVALGAGAPLDLSAQSIPEAPVADAGTPYFDAAVAAAPQVVAPPEPVEEPVPAAEPVAPPAEEAEPVDALSAPATEESDWIAAPQPVADPEATDVMPAITDDGPDLMPPLPGALGAAAVPLPDVPPLPPMPEPPLPRNPVPGFPDLPEDEAPAAPASWGPPAEAQPPAGSDHDGQTVTGNWDSSQFQRQHPGIPGQPPAPSVTAQPVARLLFSSGDVVDVDRAILIGRAPEARRFTSTEQPRLVTVPSPNQEISSTHLEVRPGSGADHGTAVVSDLGSTNGTVLVLPGLAPETLQPGVPAQLLPGSVIDLGDGLTIQVTSP